MPLCVKHWKSVSFELEKGRARTFGEFCWIYTISYKSSTDIWMVHLKYQLPTRGHLHLAISSSGSVLIVVGGFLRERKRRQGRLLYRIGSKAVVPCIACKSKNLFYMEKRVNGQNSQAWSGRLWLHITISWLIFVYFFIIYVISVVRGNRQKIQLINYRSISDENLISHIKRIYQNNLV